MAADRLESTKRGALTRTERFTLSRRFEPDVTSQGEPHDVATHGRAKTPPAAFPPRRASTATPRAKVVANPTVEHIMAARGERAAATPAPGMAQAAHPLRPRPVGHFKGQEAEQERRHETDLKGPGQVFRPVPSRANNKARAVANQTSAPSYRQRRQSRCTTTAWATSTGIK